MTLIGWWKCDETSGTTLADSSGNGRTLTLGGTYAVNASAISTDPGGSNKAVDLQSGYAERSSDTVLQNIRNAWTCVGWVRRDTSQDSQILIGMEAGGANRIPFAIICNRDNAHGTDKWGAGIYNGGWKDAVYSTALSQGVTYFLGATFDGDALKFYVDGVLRATTTGITPSAATNGSMVVGSFWNSRSNLMDGKVDDLAVWDECLSATDIAAMSVDSSTYASYPIIVPSSPPPSRLKRAVNYGALTRAVR